jgi:hypothetical protein
LRMPLSRKAKTHESATADQLTRSESHPTIFRKNQCSGV